MSLVVGETGVLLFETLTLAQRLEVSYDRRNNVSVRFLFRRTN